MKKLVALVASATVLLGATPAIEVKAYINDNNKELLSSISTNDTKVKETLKGYFENKWKQQKECRIIKNEYIMSNSLQETYDNLQSQLNYMWCENIKEELDWYKLSIEINSIKDVDGLLEVDVNTKVTFQYKNLEETSYIEEQHLIYLNNEEDKLLVERDIYDDPFSNEDYLENEELDFSNECDFFTYINKRICDININLETADIDISKYKCDILGGIQNIIDEPEDSTSIEDEQATNTSDITAKSNYNRSEAVNWALEHAYDDEVWEGNDCTYFVSKALNAGGLKEDETWYTNSYAWIRVNELRNWLVNKGYAKEQVGVAFGEKGDIIQFYNSEEKTYSHSVIITNVDYNDGNCYVSAHSNNARNVSVRNYYPSSTFTNARTLNIL